MSDDFYLPKTLKLALLYQHGEEDRTGIWREVANGTTYVRQDSISTRTDVAQRWRTALERIAQWSEAEDTERLSAIRSRDLAVYIGKIAREALKE